MAQKTREEVKALFKTGAKPSEQDFADFIESTLNIKDDAIEKPSGADTPLKITAQGTDEKLLDFYAGETNTWSINQKPSKDEIGLNISNSGGSKLFIDSRSGNVGLSIDKPTAKLHIQQTANQDALRIDDELNDTTPFLVNKDGNVGIGTTSPSAKLSINGGLHVGGDSDPGDNNLLVDGTTRTNDLTVLGHLKIKYNVGDLFTMATNEKVRIVIGKVNYDGSSNGVGFTSEKETPDSKGAYYLTFDPPFNGEPIILTGAGNKAIPIVYPNVDGTGRTYIYSRSLFNEESAQDKTLDSPFYFMAIGN